jgi:hypothetical protein
MLYYEQDPYFCSLLIRYGLEFLVYVTTLLATQIIASLILNNVLEMVWKETVVALFKILSRLLPREAEKTHEEYHSG